MMRAGGDPPRSKPAVPVVCGQCGGTAFFAPARAAGRKYCSRECYAAALRHQAREGRLPIGRPGVTPWKTPEGRARALANLRPGGNLSVLQARWEDAETRWYTCVECGEEFPSRGTKKPRYCSRRCYIRAYMRRAYAFVPGTCTVCGASFQNDRWQPHLTCSRRCAAILRSPLRWDDVRAMRRAYHEERVPISVLAAQYGVSRSTVEGIVHGRTWKERET